MIETIQINELSTMLIRERACRLSKPIATEERVMYLPAFAGFRQTPSEEQPDELTCGRTTISDTLGLYGLSNQAKFTRAGHRRASIIHPQFAVDIP
jgi:hypothetical protein